MSLEIILVFIILTGAVLFLVTGWLHRDIVPILVPVALAVLGLLRPEEVFAGFSSPAVIAVVALFVISAGLVRTGVVIWVAEYLRYLTGESSFRLILASTALPGILSGFVNVVATVFFFVPAVMRMALQGNFPRSRLLLPMAAVSLLGANLTLIGASHNLVVNSLIRDSGLDTFSLFEFLPLGGVLLLAALLYNLLLGWRFLPGGEVEQEKELVETADDLVKVYDLYNRLWELWVKDRSFAEGKTLRDIGLGKRYGLSIIALVRGGEQLPAEKEELILQGGDVLLVLGREERLREVAEEEGLFLAGHPREQKRFPLSTAELVEVVVPPRSPVIGKTLQGISFRENTGLSGIAFWREERPFRTDVGSQPLKEGDGLLLFGDRKKTRSFNPYPNFLWLHPPRKEEAPQELRHLGPAAALILFLVVISAALGWLSIAVAALAGAAAMILLGILDLKGAYESIDWRTVVLIGGLYPLGLSLENSGAAAIIASFLVGILGDYGSLAVLLALGVISMLLTQPLHNVAAAVIMTPVALDTAQALGANPKAFAMAVIVGVSAAFLMPVGHPASLLVQKPGKYSSGDYIKYGLGLCLIVLGVIVLVVPRVWPLYVS